MQHKMMVLKLVMQRHKAWKHRLSETKPGSDPTQIASKALETAHKKLEGCPDFSFLPD